jgi:hypothetical protein
VPARDSIRFAQPFRTFPKGAVTLHQVLPGVTVAWTGRLAYALKAFRSNRIMHRLIARSLIARSLIARLLLLFALAGNLVPVALAITAGPSSAHACCVRKAHKCHTIAVPESEQLTLRALSCCGHDCCRAVATSQWASPQAPAAADFTLAVDHNVTSIGVVAPATIALPSQSTRAPPAL